MLGTGSASSIRNAADTTMDTDHRRDETGTHLRNVAATPIPNDEPDNKLTYPALQRTVAVAEYNRSGER